MGGHDARYAAFISYSHGDGRQARWLHRRLEGYRMPRRLVGGNGEHGPIPRRLVPIFRDREELSAANDLTHSIRVALATSRSLIVVCSSRSAASPWVAKEIAVFREVHRGTRPIFAAVLEGNPPDCFPGGLAETNAEPLAADFRRGRDGRQLGLLKLIAGMSGVGLDALVQRDGQRKIRSVIAVTVGALIGMLAMMVLAILAVTARAEAERQNAEAEGLVEFMLTDLRHRLEGVGRLDVLSAVNRRALDHYRRQDLATLAPDALERRARILHAMGEDDGKKGLTARAIAQFQEAARSTAALLAADPNDPGRLYAHAQSEFWLGFARYDRGDFAGAKPPFERYKLLADRLVARDPGKPDWLQEAGYAEGNLCSLALARPVDRAAALRACAAALARMEAAARLSHDRARFAADLANRHAWLADAYLAAGRLDAAFAERKTQERLVMDLVARDPRNADVRDIEVTLYLGLAKLEKRAGRMRAARAHLLTALALVQRMIQLDPSNQMWRQRASRVRRDLVETPNV